MAIILFFMQASKKVPWEDPNVLNGIRGLYILSNVIIVGIYIYVGMKIDKKKGAYLSKHSLLQRDNFVEVQKGKR